MHFVCYVTIDPDARDESVERFQEHGVVVPEGVKLHGAWISLTQQETWSIFEADSAEAIMRLFEPWTDLNVHQIAPVMDFDSLKAFVDANAWSSA
jgi:hypothetical protein